MRIFRSTVDNPISAQPRLISSFPQLGEGCAFVTKQLEAYASPFIDEY